MMARQKKEVSGICDVSGCKNESDRSLSRKKVDSALEGSSLKGDGRRVKICKDHYKKYKKKTKKDRKLESLGW